MAIEGSILVTRAGHQEMALAKDFYAQDTDPGAVGAGSVWKDTANGVWWSRMTDNSGWEALVNINVAATGSDGAGVSPSASTSGTGTATVSSVAQANGNGAASATGSAYTLGTGFANAGGWAAAQGSGDAEADAHAEADTGKATVDATANRQGLVAGMQAVVDGTSARLAFNGTTPIAIPELPATPLPQDIADALVALGLVTQAAP